MDELQQRTSEIFHFPDADLIFQSSDGVRFHIHSKYLENTSGGFAPSEFPTKDEVIMLPETAETLELMFQFVYPRRQPVLAFLSFGTLGALAEASEKYEIYPAMQICNIYMTKAASLHPAAVLDYALKHDYGELMDQAAPGVALTDMITTGSLPPSYLLLETWIRYHNEWDVARRKITNSIPLGHYSTPGNTYGTPQSCFNWANKKIDILRSLGNCTTQKELSNSITSINVVPNEQTCCLQAKNELRQIFTSALVAIPSFSTLAAQS